MASVSRCCMPLACDCWMEWACLAPQDSAFLMATEQQFSTSAMVEAQLALASFIQQACWASASLISLAHWASASLMVWAQRVLASLMASVISNLFWWRAILKSETYFLWWVLREDLVASSCPKALPTSSWSWTISPGRMLAPSPKVLTGGESLQGSNHLAQHHLECSPAGMPKRRCPLAWQNLLAWERVVLLRPGTLVF